MKHIFSFFLFPFLQKISPKLFPKSGLLGLEDGSWQALDNDPQFSVKSRLLTFLSGWVRIKIKIDSENDLNPKLYLDCGEGYSEASIVVLSQVDENTYEADVLLPKSLKNIRFDPVEEPCIFTVHLFQIRSHSEILHILRQFVSIMKHDYQHGLEPRTILRKSHLRYKKHGLKGMLERLNKDYNKLHPLKNRRMTCEYVSYVHWISANEKNNNEFFDKTLFSHAPLISVIMPVYNTPIAFLKKAIDSVIEQTYPHWELCIADDASSHKDTIALLDKYIKENNKIHVCFRKENGNISLASNSALSLAKGKYITFLDHDDMLSPNALLEMVKVINLKPKVKFIYSDEDKMDENDKRFDPHFKSDWNPDMFLSQNYISHLSMVKKSTLDKVGTFRAGYEGAQDYDLYLRITRELSSDEIVHVDKILYHWRAFEGSAAYDPEAKAYTTEAGLKALKDYFLSSAESVNVVRGLLPNTYKVSYLLSHEPLVSLIIPTRDGYNILSKCITGILEKTMYKNYEIIIVDNQTTCPRTLEYLDDLSTAYGHIRVIKYDKEFNYAAINNFAVTHAKGEVLGLLNNDVEVISDHWLTEMVEHAVRPEIGAVGAKLYYDNDTIQHAGVILGIGGVAGHGHKYFKRDAHGYFSRLKIIQNYSAVTAACLVVRKSLFNEVNGLDEINLKVAFNDVDFCLKIQKLGYRNLWTPYVELYHHESVSRGTEDDEAKKARFEKEVLFMKEKWGKRLEEDRCYNVNLTKQSENFSIK